MQKASWKTQLFKSLKISATAFTAIALAGELGLKYSATAGIVTVLSIQNTKRETLKSAGRRWVAFLCAVILSWLCFSVMGYNLWAFGFYLFLFVLLCLCAGWSEAIAMDSVLISHFLIEQNMELNMLFNEALLLLIGTGMGILVNFHLRKKEKEFNRLAEDVDAQIREILQRMSQWLPKEDRRGYTEICFGKLMRLIHEAKACAVANYDNTVFTKSVEELAYITMREQQSLLLQEIHGNIIRIRHLPEQAEQVAELIGEIGQDFYRKNTVERLMNRLSELLVQMKEQPLPSHREEFESRAILFYILMQVRQFLEIKREFMIRKESLDISCKKKISNVECSD